MLKAVGDRHSTPGMFGLRRIGERDRPRGNRSRLLVVGLALAFALGCGEAPGAGRANADRNPRTGSSAIAPDWSARFPTVKRIVLEENREVITIQPYVTPDGDGYLVAEPREAQVRAYDGDGRLRARFGRTGSGPGELLGPMSARRLVNGSVAVADVMQPRLTVYGLDGGLDRTMPSPVSPLADFIVLDEDRLLLIGPLMGEPQSPRLHIWNMRTDVIERSFFELPSDPEVRRLAGNLGWTGVARSNNEIAVVFALVDTLYLFDLEGREHSRIPIPFTHFVGPTEPPPPTASPRERQEFLDRLTQPFVAVPLEDGRFLVQWARSRGRLLEWGLIAFDRSGRREFELFPTPRLLLAHGDRFIFSDPEAEEPNHWLITMLRRP